MTALSMHTLRPVRKLSAEGSLRLSADFVGSMRSPPQSPSALPAEGEGSGSGSRGKLRKRSKDEIGNAGRTLVEQVVLPTLQKVGIGSCCGLEPLTNSET